MNKIVHSRDFIVISIMFVKKLIHILYITFKKNLYYIEYIILPLTRIHKQLTIKKQIALILPIMPTQTHINSCTLNNIIHRSNLIEYSGCLKAFNMARNTIYLFDAS